MILNVIGGIMLWYSALVVKDFSIDNQCPAFQNISKLVNNNTGLYSKEEIDNYVSNSHPHWNFLTTDDLVINVVMDYQYPNLSMAIFLNWKCL